MYLCAMKNFETIAQCIRDRRSIKPQSMNGQIIPDEQIQQLLELADWAPTHAFTEPWRFIVYSGAGMQKFSDDQAELYRTSTPADKFKEATYEKIKNNCEKVSHNILVYMKRGSNLNIPVMEEICAVAAAVQNILLAASAAGIGVLWSTGGVTLRPAFKEFLQLGEEDLVIGQLYLGYSDSKPEGVRKIDLTEKVKWVK